MKQPNAPVPVSVIMFHSITVIVLVNVGAVAARL